MKKIANLVEQIDEELEGAQNYAEMYVSMKADGRNSWATTYKEMASDEIRHAMNLHSFTVEEINKLNAVTTPPQEMLDKWDKAHKQYIERTAIIKQMLTM